MERRNNTSNRQADNSARKWPSPKAFFTNMSIPMPLHRKLYLLLRNNSVKIWKRQPCCGHRGQPGC
ncbi:MAG: hypothetical protein DRI39_08025 [Chloroflexi bacterium]|nr:MAG: hypothetical protein DRI39_08025 [Chloroflexota bacterium]